MTDQLETYDSAGLGVIFINYEKGKLIATHALFENLQKKKIIEKKFIEKEAFFNPMRFLEEFDQEKYFELLKSWKEEEEQSYLENTHTYVLIQ